MPASAVETKKWFRPKGWFSDRELGIVVNRVLRDDPSKGEHAFRCCGSGISPLISEMTGDMHNRQAVTLRRLWDALRDVDLWPLYLLGLIIFIPMAPMNNYVTLILKSIGFDTVRSSSKLPSILM